MARTQAPAGMRNISTTYQIAYETYDGNVQIRQISSRLWEVLPRGAATLFETSKPAAVERAFQMAATRNTRRARRL